jgi:hypothetical protein
MEDIDMEEHGEDLQAYIDAVEKAGGESVLLPLVTNEDEAKKILLYAFACEVLDSINCMYFKENILRLAEQYLLVG